MNRLERLHAIAETLRRSAPTPISSAVLADRFDVSRRTIERDLNALREAGVPLYSEMGRTGGQVTLDQQGSSVLTLSAAEVSALLVALAAAGPQLPFGDAGASAANRLLDSLGPITRVGVEELRSRVRVRQQPTSARRARRTVEEGVRRGVVVNLDYVDAQGEMTTRSVDPVGFYNGRDGWALIAWCHLRAAGRLFRLDRIRSARLTTRPAVRHDVDDTLGWVPDELTTP